VITQDCYCSENNSRLGYYRTYSNMTNLQVAYIIAGFSGAMRPM